MNRLRTQSPYLADDNRLAQVIAAIQSMGTYKFYKLTFDEWADRITGDTSGGRHWRKVFEQHPEFFRLDASREQASLVLRRQRQKLFRVDHGDLVAPWEYLALEEGDKRRVSRAPLDPAEIGILVNIAVDLHARATERERDRRWLIAPALAFLGALVGGLIQHVFR